MCTSLAPPVAEARIAALVHNALGRGWLRLHYQPIVSLGTMEVVGHEALLRIEHPALGMIPPNVFVSEVEHDPVMVELGHWVIEEAVRRTAVAWRGGRRTWVAVNVAVTQLIGDDLGDGLAAALARHDLPAGAVHIELTESINLLADIHGRVELQRVADLGCPVWLDDFGTGFSSFSYLQHLPVSGIKIDRVFVADIGASARSAAIARSMLAVGHDLGIDVIAEGVETDAEADALRALGCDLAQGYRFGHPVAEPRVGAAATVELR